MLIERSDAAKSVVCTGCDVLFAVAGSVVPAGTATVAVLVIVAVVCGAVAVIVIVTLPLAGNVGIVPETLVPDEAGFAHTAPPVADPQLAAAPVTPAGKLSLYVAPSTEL